MSDERDEMSDEEMIVELGERIAKSNDPEALFATALPMLTGVAIRRVGRERVLKVLQIVTGVVESNDLRGVRQINALWTTVDIGGNAWHGDGGNWNVWFPMHVNEPRAFLPVVFSCGAMPGTFSGGIWRCPRDPRGN